MKYFEILITNVEGVDDESGALGFWDFSGEIAKEIERCIPIEGDPFLYQDIMQDIIYRYIVDMLLSEVE